MAVHQEYFHIPAYFHYDFHRKTKDLQFRNLSFYLLTMSSLNRHMSSNRNAILAVSFTEISHLDQTSTSFSTLSTNTQQPSTSTVTGQTPASTVSGQTSGSTITGQTTQSTTGTTPKKCDEMPAIDEETARHIAVLPTDLPESEKVSFQPTSSTGVSFPSDETTPTITVNFGKPAEVQSVVLPRDKTPNANVEQFEVTFYSTDGQKINPQPVKSTVSPSTDTKTPASLNPQDIPSDKPVSRLDIKVLSTTDDQSPKGVILDIKACTESISSKSYLLSHIKQFE